MMESENPSRGRRKRNKKNKNQKPNRYDRKFQRRHAMTTGKLFDFINSTTIFGLHLVIEQENTRQLARNDADTAIRLPVMICITSKRTKNTNFPDKAVVSISISGYTGRHDKLIIDHPNSIDDNILFPFYYLR